MKTFFVALVSGLFFSGLFLALSETPALAQGLATRSSSAPMDFQLPLSQGHWQIGGSAGWYNLGKKSGNLQIIPRAEYFLMDTISVGGGIGFNFYNGPDDTFALQELALIPSGTLYFWQGAGMAAYVGQRVPIYFPKYDSVRVNGRTALGLDFFINSYVAIAPEIAWTYGSNSGYVDLLAQVAAYF